LEQIKNNTLNNFVTKNSTTFLKTLQLFLRSLYEEEIPKIKYGQNKYRVPIRSHKNLHYLYSGCRSYRYVSAVFIKSATYIIATELIYVLAWLIIIALAKEKILKEETK